MPNEFDRQVNKKAFQINMDPKIYGTFAEIGAGQEVARKFFQVGGAAGTVAKTMSAYDMTFSDAIYGASGRYVCRQRLWTMLDHEFELLLERLDPTVGAERTFFVFANTVAARSFRRHDESHGWLGVRFQTAPRSPVHEIIIHVRMLDAENVQQQEALGIIGVNLIYGAFFLAKRPEALIGSLMDDLSPGRMEVDMIRFSGPDFEKLDQRLMALRLVTQGLTKSALFRADGEV
ncbi:MAG TPA: TonB-dependent receptor, partial [Chthoniobacterales bacterium]